jgi:hypothetical protein
VSGFVKIRRGIEEHMIDGKIGFFELGVFTTVHLQADYRTGVWTGSAPRLAATAPRGSKLRDLQRALKRLEEIRFIRMFHKRGKRGNYRVLLHKYEPNTPALRGKRLNAFKSPSWRDLVFEDCAHDDADTSTDTVAETDAVTVAEAAPYQEVRNKKEEANKAQRARPGERAKMSASPPGVDPLFEKFWGDFPKKIRRKEARASWPALSEAERIAATESLAAFKICEQWQREGGRYIPAADRFLGERRWEDIPPAVEWQKGIGNARTGRLHGDALTEANLRTAGLIE